MNGFFHLAERVSSLSRAIAAEPVREPRRSRRRPVDADACGCRSAASRSPPAPAAATTRSPSWRTCCRPASAIPASPRSMSGADRWSPIRAPFPIRPTTMPVRWSDSSPTSRSTTPSSDAYLVSVQLGNGSWANFTVPVAPSPRLWSDNAMLATMVVIALVLAGSIWALRRLTAPYALLANAAERLGRDINATSLPEKGPREVRAAAHAFNLMQGGCAASSATATSSSPPSRTTSGRRSPGCRLQGRVRRGLRPARPHARRPRRHRGDDPLGARLRQRHRPARGARIDRPDLAPRIAVQRHAGRDACARRPTCRRA